MPDGRDVTESYGKAFGDGGTRERAETLLRGRQVVFVRGFLSEAVVNLGRFLPPALRVLTERLPAVHYFDSHFRWLGPEQAGIPYVAVDIESEASVAHNAKTIRDELEKATSPDVTLVTHSKGCLDALEALLICTEPARARVERWIAIQGPFQGTPIADVIGENEILRKVAARVLELAKGSVDGLLGMQTSARRDYLDGRQAAIAELLEQVPTVCLGSSVSERDLCATFLAPSLLLIDGAPGGGPNDGLVPVTSAQLAGARFVALDRVDHAMPVMNSLGEFDRVRCFQSLVCALEDSPA